MRRRIGAIRKNELTSETRGKERSTIDTKSALKEKRGGWKKWGPQNSVITRNVISVGSFHFFRIMRASMHRCKHDAVGGGAKTCSLVAIGVVSLSRLART